MARGVPSGHGTDHPQASAAARTRQIHHRLATDKLTTVTQPTNTRALRAIRWWWVLLAAIAIAAATWAATTWLLSVAGHNPSLRIQAIKVGLTVAAGTGGAAALLLA